jgi:hypothetical protein
MNVSQSSEVAVTEGHFHKPHLRRFWACWRVRSSRYVNPNTGVATKLTTYELRREGRRKLYEMAGEFNARL